MTDSGEGSVAARSLASISGQDLERLAQIARADREERFRRKPRWAVYGDRVLVVALCQGAALHLVAGQGGVKDFDMWTFYAAAPAPNERFPERWRTTADFGPSPHGRWPSDPDRYVGRRVDLIARSLHEPVDADPIAALRRYLADGRSTSARALAAKAVVAIDPPRLRGRVIWPVE